MARYKALDELIEGRRKAVADFAARKITSGEARSIIRDYDEKIRAEERRHKKAVEGFQASRKGWKS